MSDLEMALKDQYGLTPVVIDKHGPGYSHEDVERAAIGSIKSGQFYKAKGKIMTDQIDRISEQLNDAEKRFSASLNRFNSRVDDFQSHSKKASGNIRKATNDLASGLERIERQANFERLEKLACLLDSCNKSLQGLADLQRSGILEKISSSLK